MKTLSIEEIDTMIEDHQDLLGLELQQVRYNEKALQLKFYGNKTNYWLTFSFKPGSPYFFVSNDKVRLIRPLKKPLSLFVKTHFLGHKLVALFRDEQKGRVLSLKFTTGDQINVTFVTGRVNVEARKGDKSVFAFKPKEILENFVSDPKFQKTDTLRSSQDFFKIWQESGKIQTKSLTVDITKQLKKKKNGLQKMQEKLEELKKDDWSQVGHFLKTNATLNHAPSWVLERIDSSQTLAWNIEFSFEKSKKNQAKIKGTQQRINKLIEEITSLETGHIKDLKKNQSPSLLQKAKLKGKTQKLSCGRLFIGRSGADNLKLLRQAKPWFLWLHIKDYPGAYGILEKEKKDLRVDEKTLRQAGEAVIRQSLPKGQEGRFDLIYAECRYVRPIKGAKSGQVTYSHEKVVSIKV